MEDRKSLLQKYPSQVIPIELLSSKFLKGTQKWLSSVTPEPLIYHLSQMEKLMFFVFQYLSTLGYYGSMKKYGD